MTTKANRISPAEQREWWLFLLLVGPNLALFAIFTYWPLIYNGYLSFVKWDMLAPVKIWVGLDNYRFLFTQPEFRLILLNTLVFTIASVVLTGSIGLAMALLLNQGLRGRNTVRSIVFSPVMLSGAAIGIVWIYIFDPRYGLLDMLLGFVGLNSPNWLLDTAWAMPAVIIVHVWKTVGYAVVIYIAGLQAIPRELYEAVVVDGGGAWARFLHVTLPGLSPVIFFLILTTVLASCEEGSEREFEQQILSGAAWRQYNSEPTMTTSSPEVFQKATQDFQRSAATSAAWVGHRHGLLGRIAAYTGLVLCVLLIGLPVYWMISGAFKTPQEVYAIPPTWIPLQPTLANFSKAWNSAPFERYYLNSFIVTIFGSGFEVFFAVTSAYAFAFLRFPGKPFIFLLLLAALMVPAQVTILPNYLTVARFGWINTYQGIIIPGASVAYGTFLLRQYYRTLPREIMDAAHVDGASHLRILWSVVAPLSKPAIVSFALLSIVAKWNEFLWPLIVTNTKDMRVLPIGIYWLMVEEGTIDWGVVMAGTLFVVLPVLFVFLYAQRYIVDGIAAGAVKG